MRSYHVAILIPILVGFALWFPRVASVPTTIDDFAMPGSQPLDSGTLEGPSGCNCHEGFNSAVEPMFNWQGSMMAQSMRDPLFLATMAVANQDAPESGDLCLRCHTPKGWLEGRSEPTSGSALLAADRDGIMCDFCHRAIKPSEIGVNPFPSDATYTSTTYSVDQVYLATIDSIPPVEANGMYVIAATSEPRRGPLTDPASPHNSTYSPFHKESAMCGTCHDVSNPVFSADGSGRYVANEMGQPPPDVDPHALFPIERTYSEWLASDYNTPTGVYAPQFGGNKDYVATCQDCHMRDVTGKACKQGSAPTRTNLSLHDLTGGNTFVPLLVSHMYPDETNATALAAGIERARRMLELAATMDLDVVADADSFKAIVRITNETGHKLPSGYPEGRRIWIELEVFDGVGAEVFESGEYEASEGTLEHDPYLKVYEIEPGISPSLASALGLTAGPSYHFVLNDTIYFDNRIPPRGFTNAAFEAIQSPSVGYSYPDGQYWDDTEYPLPSTAREVRATLYYQTTSKEFVEFLRDENTTNFWGDSLHAMWTAFGKSPPVVMQRDTFFVEGGATADLQVLLEGPYAGSDSMSTGASFESAAPLTQPYGNPPYVGTSVEYYGAESVSNWAGDLVDWVLVEFRTGTGGGTAVDTMAAILKKDGSVVSPGAEDLQLPVSLVGSYYVVIRHRNHLAVMTPSAVDFSGGSGSWDFRTGSGQAFSGGGVAMKALAGGRYGMFACDANADKFVTAPDFNLWNTATTSGATGYRREDCNLDGDVTAPDFNVWNANTTAGAASQVPN